METSALFASLAWARPELALAVFALLGAVIGAAWKERAAGMLNGLTIAALIAAGVLAILQQPAAPVLIFGGALVVDGYAVFAKALIGFSAAATLLLGADHMLRQGDRRFEFPLIVALSTLGMFVMASANDLITLYVGLELQSLGAYVLAAFARDDSRSSEAGLKYFVLGALASGLLLYGASLIYGFTGAVEFGAIAAAAQSGEVGVIFGLVFLICGLAFKVSAAPFHMWTPDVYEGAPTPVTALFAAAPKVAAVVLLARVLYGPFGALEFEWRQVIVALSAISLIVGSLAALAQTNIKRLMAYSSIANMGFVLLAVAAGPRFGGDWAALIYLATYLPATIGIFAIILAMRRGGVGLERLEDFAGLAARRPWMGAVLTILFFSLTGIPPLAGFFGKWYAFQAGLGAGLWPLVVLAAVATVVGAGYYLKVLAIVWFQPSAGEIERSSGAIAVTAGLSSLLTLGVLTVFIGYVTQWAIAASQASFPL